MKYHVFICHSHEDKNDFVKPLYQELKTRGVEVWYDDFSLKPGDSLRQSIDEGLKGSKFGIVVLSKSFFNKKWANWELDGLVQRHLEKERNVIIPIWYKIDLKLVSSYSPSLAGIVAIKYEDNIPAIVDKVLDVVKPAELIDKLDFNDEFFNKDTVESDEGFYYSKISIDDSLNNIRQYISDNLEKGYKDNDIDLFIYSTENEENQLLFVQIEGNPDCKDDENLDVKFELGSCFYSQEDPTYITKTELKKYDGFKDVSLANSIESILIIPIVVKTICGSEVIKGYLSIDSRKEAIFKDNEKLWLSSQNRG